MLTPDFYTTPGSEHLNDPIVTFGYGTASQQNGMLIVPSNKNINLDIYTILYSVSSADDLSLSTLGYKDYL